MPARGGDGTTPPVREHSACRCSTPKPAGPSRARTIAGLGDTSPRRCAHSGIGVRLHHQQHGVDLPAGTQTRNNRRKETEMISHDYLLDRLSREIMAERVQEAKNARVARIVAAFRREN